MIGNLDKVVQLKLNTQSQQSLQKLMRCVRITRKDWIFKYRDMINVWKDEMLISPILSFPLQKHIEFWHCAPQIWTNVCQWEMSVAGIWTL